MNEIYHNNNRIFAGIQSYTELTESSLPMINSVTLIGNKTADELNLYTQDQVRQLIAQIQQIKYSSSLPSTPTVNTLYYVGTQAPYNAYLYTEDEETGGIVRLDLGTIGGDIDPSLYQTILDDNLTTTSKSVVGAINENKTNIDLKQDITDTTLNTTSKTVVGAINELKDSIPNLPVGAIWNAYKYGSSGYTCDTAIFNMDFTVDESGAVGCMNRRVFPIESFTNPIDSSTFTGLCYTTEYINGTNLFIEQRFVRNSPGRFEFYRNATVTLSSIDDYKDKITSTTITWNDWYPLEYPATSLTAHSSIISLGDSRWSVTGGILSITFDKLKVTSGGSYTNVAYLPYNLIFKNPTNYFMLTVDATTYQAPSFRIIERDDNGWLITSMKCRVSQEFYGTVSFALGY